MKLLIGIFSYLFLLIVINIGAFFIGKYTSGNIVNTIQTSPTPLPTITTQLPTPTPIIVETTPQATPINSSDTQTKTLKSNSILDGFESNNGAGNLTVDIRAGRNAYLVTRGFVSFDLKEIPKNAKIESAVLRLYQFNVSGSPYSSVGNLLVDHLDFGATLENEDYLLPSLTSNLAVLSQSNNFEWKEAIVTEAIKDDLENFRPRSQYRIHFSIESIGGTQAGGDFAYFESGENYSGSQNVPELVVTFKNP